MPQQSQSLCQFPIFVAKLTLKLKWKQSIAFPVTIPTTQKGENTSRNTHTHRYPFHKIEYLSVKIQDGYISSNGAGIVFKSLVKDQIQTSPKHFHTSMDISSGPIVFSGFIFSSVSLSSSVLALPWKTKVFTSYLSLIFTLNSFIFVLLSKFVK